MQLRHLFAVSILSAVGLASTACMDGSTGRVSLNLATRPSASGAASSLAAAGDSAVFALGTDTVIARSVELVLSEIELKPVESAVSCGDDGPDGELDADSTDGAAGSDGEHEDECDEIETASMLVQPGLGTNPEHAITVNLPVGTFDELKFKIHKPEDDSPADQAFIAANPDFAHISIRVTGTYSAAGTRSDFTFTSDLNARQEVAFDPPLAVADASTTSLTIRFDLSRWFVNAAATALVNPTTANPGGVNEHVVRDNIRGSIRAFRDDDHDGEDDDHEDGGHEDGDH